MLEIVRSNIQPFQQPDFLGTRLLICEELGLQARSVLACHELLGSVWKLLCEQAGCYGGAVSLSCFRKVEMG